MRSQAVSQTRDSYRGRNAAKSPVSRLVQDHLETFLVGLRTLPPIRPRPHPSTERKLRQFLECGVPRFGVMRFKCPACGEDLFVPFSCKARGLCPSCDAKRAILAMSHAVDSLLPDADYRQWVLVVPKRLRYFLNSDPRLSGEVAGIFAKAIDEHLKAGSKTSGSPAQLHFLQRFGASLNLHVHDHAVVSEGVFVKRQGILGPRLEFVKTPPPTDRAVSALSEKIRRRVLRRFQRLGVLDHETVRQMLAWEHSGFSVHAQVMIPQGDREGLESLIYYCARPGLSQKRLTYKPDKDLVLYRTDRLEGKSVTLRLHPLEFLRRWTLLMPPPHKNLIRYYGALAPNSPMRQLLVGQAIQSTARERRRKKLDETLETTSRRARSWAKCLARVFEVDPLVCRLCGETMVPAAVILADTELVRLLTHLGLPTDLPKTKPVRAILAREPEEDLRGPPEDDGCQLDPHEVLCGEIAPPVDEWAAA